MGNGANRIFNVLKNTSQKVAPAQTKITSLTVKSIKPLIFKRDDKLEITEDFCSFNKTVNPSSFKVGDIVTAFIMNDGQKYFIQQNDSQSGSGAVDYNDLSNKPSINNVEIIGQLSLEDLDLLSKSDINKELNNKVNKVAGKQLSTNDFTDVHKNKLENIDTDLYVKKSGDTMTGTLNFNNVDDFAVITKIRKLDDNRNYLMNVGLGAPAGKPSIAMELYDNNSNQLIRVDFPNSGFPFYSQNNQEHILATREIYGYMCIALRANTDVTCKSSYDVTSIVPMNTIKKTIGTGLTFANNCIKIGAGIKNVRISGIAMVTGNNPVKIVSICKNNEIICQSYITQGTNWITVSFPTYIIDVNENDIISMKYGSSVANSTFRMGGINYTNLNVEII